MPGNVIRQDVIEVKFDTDFGNLTKATEGLDDLKKQTSGVSDGLDDIKKSVSSGFGTVGQSIGNAASDMTEFNDALKKVGGISNIDNVTEDLKLLNEKIDVQKGLCNNLQQEYTKVSGEMGETSTEALKLKKNLIDQTNSLNKMTRESESLTKALDTVQSGLKNSAKSSKNTKTALKNLAAISLTKLASGLKNISTQLTNIAKKAATVAFNALKKLASISLKMLVAGIGAATVAIGGLVAKSVSAYANYEQLVGGVETLLGAKGAQNVEEYAKLVGKSARDVRTEFNTLMKSQNTVLKNANNAYKTAGLSANEYMETVTGFSASLLQSLGGDTQKAAAYADIAILDMSDNANKMGTDMSSIQDAYQGFAKQNYTMLDNLKLGYGGTKEEMQRLVKDAAKIDKSIDANSLSYANIVKAIHAVQVETGIYGTTQKEAEKTISGSLNSMKAAWGNFLPALVKGGDDLDDCIDNLVSSVKTFAKNIIPTIKKALSGVGKLIKELAPIVSKELPKLVDDILPSLITSAILLAKGLAAALPNIVRTVADTIKENKDLIIDAVKEIGSQTVKALYEAITGQPMGEDTFNNLKSTIDNVFDSIGKIISNSPICKNAFN